MENIGFNNDVQVGGKIFHVQTEYMEPTEKAVSSVFEDGRLIMKKNLELSASQPAAQIRKQVDLIHSQMMQEIEIMFYISDKVRTIRHAPSNYKLGLLFFSRNLFEEAIDEFRKAVAIDPEFAEAYLQLGRSYLKANLLQQAKETLVEGLSRKKDFADLHFYLGYAYFLLNLPHEALKEFNSALAINPTYAKAQFWISYLYFKTIIDNLQDNVLPPKIERLNSAKENLKKILEQGSLFKAKHLQKALEAIEENDFEKVLAALDKAAEDSDGPSEAEIENEFYLKFMFGGKGKDDQFILDYTAKLKELLGKYPDYPDLHNQLGIAYLIQCRNLFLNALEEFRHALTLNSDFSRAQKNLKLAENDGKGFLILLRAILK
ncbi:MAG: tetratricopeptide repeat protein [Calditrichaeota bacterium]|nr:tetratricopeptide repeat protein [Calditrichota bacterium]